MDWRKAIRELYFCIKLTPDNVSKMHNKAYTVPERIVLLFIDHGQMRLSVNEQPIELNEHQMMFVRPHEEVRMTYLDASATLCIIAFTPALPDQSLKQFGPTFFEYVRNRSIWEIDDRSKEALNAFYNLYDYNCNQTVGLFSTEIANSLFSVFLQSFYQNVRSKVDTKTTESHSLASRNLMSRFFQLLGEQYKNEHTVNFYAEKLCISSKYLTQVVKTSTSYTPKDLIDRRLGMEALFLLTKTTRNIQEISIDLGFPDQSYFGRFFKRLFGLSPLNYRLNPDMSLLEKLSVKKS